MFLHSRQITTRLVSAACRGQRTVLHLLERPVRLDLLVTGGGRRGGAGGGGESSACLPGRGEVGADPAQLSLGVQEVGSDRREPGDRRLGGMSDMW